MDSRHFPASFKYPFVFQWKAWENLPDSTTAVYGSVCVDEIPLHFLSLFLQVLAICGEMNAQAEDDDYWDKSDSKAYNFDDDEVSNISEVSYEDFPQSDFPLNLLISDHDLQMGKCPAFLVGFSIFSKRRKYL